MKKMTNEKLAAVNGGWAKKSDKYLPIGNYHYGCKRKYTGTHNGIAYIVYYDTYTELYFRTA